MLTLLVNWALCPFPRLVCADQRTRNGSRGRPPASQRQPGHTDDTTCAPTGPDSAGGGRQRGDAVRGARRRIPGTARTSRVSPGNQPDPVTRATPAARSGSARP
ncbi:hypothetical protein GCM10009531_45060 [Actinoplanes capillaceus]